MVRTPDIPRSRRSLAVVLVAAVVVGALAGTLSAVPDPMVQDDPAGDRPEYDTDRLVADRLAVDGQFDVAETSDRGVVLVDQRRHRFEREEIQPLANAITASGYEVEYLRFGDDLERELARAEAFVVIDPAVAYSQAEADAVEEFTDSGGRVLLLGEPSRSEVQRRSLVSVDNKLGSLATRFGMSFGDAHLYNMESNDGNYLNILATGTDHSLASGVDRTTMYTSAAVESENGSAVLVGVDGTRSSADGLRREVPLAVVDGNVLAVGDTEFLSPANHRVVDNEQFVGNVATFLVTGDRTRTLLDYPWFVEPEATVRYTDDDLLNVSQELRADLDRNRPGQSRIVRESETVPTDETDVLVTTFEYLEKNPDVDTGIEVDDTGTNVSTVSVGEFSANETGLVVVHRPADGPGLVVAAESPKLAAETVESLDGDWIDEYAVSNSTAVRVVRTEESGSRR